MKISFVYDIVSEIINMSATAGVVILAVLLVRLLLTKAPKVFSYALWGVVLFRLLCPVSFSSQLSLMNLTQPVNDLLHDVGESSRPQAGADAVIIEKSAEKPDNTPESMETGKTEPNGISQGRAAAAFRVASIKKPGVTAAFAFAIVWISVIWILLIVNLVSFIRARHLVSNAMPFRDNIFLSDEVDMPFCLGIVKPHIYLPSSLEEGEREYIILHEQYHIKRGDHIIKLAAFAALCIHWFNPLVWLAFVLAGKDMEMSCDEAVMRKAKRDIRADYSASLLRLATGKRIFTASPLAFGEGDPKQRIQNIMDYKKPGIWLLLGGVVICIIAAFVLATDPEHIELFENMDRSEIGFVTVYYPDGTRSFYSDPEKVDAIVAFMESMKCRKASADHKDGFGIQVDFCSLDEKQKRFIFRGDGKVSVGDWVAVSEEVRKYNEEDGKYGVVIDGAYVTVDDDYAPPEKMDCIDSAFYKCARDYSGELETLLGSLPDDGAAHSYSYLTNEQVLVGETLNEDGYLPAESITEEAIPEQDEGHFVTAHYYDDPNLTEPEITLTFTVEGMTEVVPAIRVLGEGFSLLIPADGWKMSAPDLWCSEENPMVSIWVAGPVDSAEPLSDEAVKEKLAEMGFTRIHPITHTYRKLQDGYFTDVDVKRDEKDSVWYVSCSYPEEAEEGWGRRLHTIADSFNAVPQMLELTEEEQEAAEVVSAFAVAYLKNDTKTMERYLKNGVQASSYDVEVKEPVIERIHGLDLMRSVAAREHEYGEVSVTFRPSPGADAFQYLTVGLEYTDGEWKIPWYYLDA